MPDGTNLPTDVQITPEAPKPATVQPAETPKPPDPLATQMLEVIKDLPDNPDEALRRISSPETNEFQGRMKSREGEYLANFSPKNKDALKARYEDERAKKDFVDAKLAETARNAGVNIGELPDGLGKVELGSEGDQQQVEALLAGVVEQYFNSELASINPEKRDIVQKQTAEYLTLLRNAKSEGAIASNVTVGDVYKLVAENITALALQDRAASENMLGDHGVRHLVDHNINACMEIADAMPNAGITTMDRLMMHQIMMYHDLGYAMAPVRDAINSEGIRGQDSGHNVLAAQYVREKFAQAGGTWQKVFGQDAGENQETIHRGILYHDKDAQGKPGIRFIVDASKAPEGENVRLTNLESIVRTADNTDAFERKLPELLYGFPDSIKYMRLMKTAGEIGDQDTLLAIRKQLGDEIRNTENFSKDDKEALLMAVFGKGNENGEDPKKGIGANAYERTIPRICGNNPKFSMEADGTLVVTVDESAIHQEVMKVFGMESYVQLEKFLTDLSGEKIKINPESPRVDAGPLSFRLATGEAKSAERTDYQERVEELTNVESELSVYSELDFQDGSAQSALEKSVQMYNSDGQTPDGLKKLTDLASHYGIQGDSDLLDKIGAKIGEFKLRRKNRLLAYIQDNK